MAENPMNFTPGAIGFDPLKLYAKHDAKGQRALLWSRSRALSCSVSRSRAACRVYV